MLKNFSRSITKPDNYKSNFTDEQKKHVVQVSADYVLEMNPESKVIIAGIYGSSLVGTDHAGSDFDIMVVIDTEHHKSYSLGKSERGVAAETDIKVVPFKIFIESFIDTFHAYGIINSEYSLVDSAWESFFRSFRPNLINFKTKAQSTATSTLYSGSEESKPLAKRWKQIVQAYVSSQLRLYVTREELSHDYEHRMEIFDWVSESFELRVAAGNNPDSQSKSIGPSNEEKARENLERLRDMLT